MNGWALYVPGHSWLHRADPRLKLGLASMGVILLLAYGNLWLMLAALSLTILMLRSAAIPWQRLRAIVALILPVTILIVILWPLFYRAGPTWISWWRIHITGWAVAQGFATAIRILTIAFLSSMVLLTTEMRALLRGLLHLGLPFEGALTITIGLSYIPRIQHTYEQVTEAQMARGLLLTSGGFLTRARARVPILVAALVSTFRSADVLARALECRGFGRQDVRRTSLYEIRWRAADTALALALLLLSASALYARFVLGIGAHPFYLW
ncbi:MAG: energy-coupling factor transporter transmembrane component T family protein [Anaerolineae bacterium]